MKAKEPLFHCCKCNSKVSVKRTKNTVYALVDIRHPGVLCDKCHKSKIIDSATILDFNNVLLHSRKSCVFNAINMDLVAKLILESKFKKSLYESIIFFCDLFYDVPEVYDYGAIRTHSSGQKKKAYKILELGRERCKNADSLLVETAALMGMDGKAIKGLRILEDVKIPKGKYFTIKGNLYRNLEEWKEAASCWEMGTKEDETDFFAWNNLGYYYLQVTQDFKQAEKHYTKACKALPSHRRFRAYLGDSLFFQEKYEEALEQYEKALKIPDDNYNLEYSIKQMIQFSKEKLC